MPKLSDTRIPVYCHHRAGGQAVVLGTYRSAASRGEYDRLIAEWLAAGRRLPRNPTTVTVAEELNPLTKLYAQTPAVEFGPLRLKAVRDSMMALGCAVLPHVSPFVAAMIGAWRTVAAGPHAICQVVDQQLQRAGVRLTMILTRTLLHAF